MRSEICTKQTCKHPSLLRSKIKHSALKKNSAINPISPITKVLRHVSPILITSPATEFKAFVSETSPSMTALVLFLLTN